MRRCIELEESEERSRGNQWILNSTNAALKNIRLEFDDNQMPVIKILVVRVFRY